MWLFLSLYSRLADYFAILEIRTVSPQFCSSLGLFSFLSHFPPCCGSFCFCFKYAPKQCPICWLLLSVPLLLLHLYPPKCTFFWPAEISGSFQVSGNRIMATSGKKASRSKCHCIKVQKLCSWKDHCLNSLASVCAQSSEMALIPCSLAVWQAKMQKEGINSQIQREDFLEVGNVPIQPLRQMLRASKANVWRRGTILPVCT